MGSQSANGGWWSSLLARGLLSLVPGDFVIRHRPGGRTVVRGRVAAAKLGAIEEFFARDLGAAGAVVVRGTFAHGRRSGPGALRLQFAGNLGPGQRQQVRNFLVELLA